MNFHPHRTFKIPKRSNGLIDTSSLKEFWEDVDEKSNYPVSDAIGCYIFSIRAGKGSRPWYIGMAEKQTFRRECFTPHKLNHYNNAIAARKGTPILTLVAKYTLGGKLVRPTGKLHEDIQQLETMLIAVALRRNDKLLNVKDTKLLKNMVVPGLLNSPKGKPYGSVTEFKKLLGL